MLGERLKSIYDGMVPSNRLHAVPNFAGDEFLLMLGPLKASFSNVDPLRLLFLSNLLPGKGHIELLVALALLPVGSRGDFRWILPEVSESEDDEIAFKQAVQKDRGELRSTCVGLCRRTQERVVSQGAFVLSSDLLPL